ncbi:SUMF1/EgtB/PvdO family nonheme iron enzyme [bacterium]|nr:SUMF1/EgtB/PvdO family nonheme iron enzyme [bacterium]
MRFTSFSAGLILIICLLVIGLETDANSNLSARGSNPTAITIDLPGIPADAKSLELILVQPGKFVMGSDKADSGSYEHSWPEHEVTITRPFYLGKLEITQAQYEALRGNKANHSKHKGPDLPVEKASWYDTWLFLRRLNKLKLGQFRLPSEAEWEYACMLSDSLGILDMKAGLCEWCEDKWQKPHNRGPQTNPRRKGGFFSFIWPLTNRVLKGASNDFGPENMSAFRSFEQSIDYHYLIGFRIVKELE